MRSEDDHDELLETGEIEVVQTELRAAIEGARPAIRQVRPASDQPYGARRASVRKIGTTPGTGPVSSASPASVSGASPSSIGPRHHSSLGASVSLGAINQALGAMSTEPAFGDREERPASRAIVRTPAPAPSPLSTRASTRLPSPTAAMQQPAMHQPPIGKALPNLAPPANPHGARRDEEETMARPISSPPPPVSMPASRARMAPPSGGIAVPTPFDELEEKTNAVMPIGEMPAETTEEMPIAQRGGAAGGAGLQLQTPPTIMGGGAAMPAAFRAHVLQQMQAAREGQAQTAMDQLIAQQLANVQRAQPIADPAAVAAPSAAQVTDVAGFTGLAQPVPLPGAIRAPGMPLSSSNVDVPAMAVTARTKVRFGNPALSWTAGLLVVGACVGAAVFVMGKRDSQAEAAAQAARSVQTAAAVQQAQMASTGTYLGQQAAAPQAPAVAAAPYGGLPANGAAASGAVANAATPSPSTTAAAAALTAAALNDGTTGMGGTMAPGNGTQPVMQLTPAQLAVMTGGAAPATPAAAPTPAAATPLAAAPVSAASDDGASHHHHSHATVAANDSPTPRAAAPAPTPRAIPAPAPKPAPAPVAKKAAPAGNDDMDSAAKALAKAQLEQSL